MPKIFFLMLAATVLALCASTAPAAEHPAMNIPSDEEMYALMEKTAEELEASGQKDVAAQLRASMQLRKQMMEQYGDRIKAARSRIGLMPGGKAAGGKKNGAQAMPFNAGSGAALPGSSGTAPKPKYDKDGWEILE